MSKIDTTAVIHKSTIVEDGATIGKNVTIGPFCVIGKDVTLGDDNIIHSHAVITGKTTIGRGNEIFPFAILGSKPLDKKYAGEDSELIIGDRNQIREHVSITLGTAGGGMVTRVGNDCLFMNGAHISHDAQVGDGVILVTHATLGGHVVVGDGAILGGLAAVHQFVRVGQYAMIGGLSRVVDDVPPFTMANGPDATMQGLNLLGLKRQNIDKQDIKLLQKQLYYLFSKNEKSPKPLDEKLREVSLDKNPLVQKLVDFLQRRTHRGIAGADF
ncbi:MAG: acyl-ACP--UDP-N-acetylglucosamine O-acyltransferase [Hydrotalea sp.]|nr:acyl-ACP--UDP-N-acetylglucosamine O-acyltransferase [Hydrotalea sp.]